MRTIKIELTIWILKSLLSNIKQINYIELEINYRINK